MAIHLDSMNPLILYSLCRMVDVLIWDTTTKGISKMTKDQLLQTLANLMEHEDCTDYKLAIDIAIEIIDNSHAIYDTDVDSAYNALTKHHTL